MGIQLFTNGGNFDCINWGSVALAGVIGAVGGAFGTAGRAAGWEFSHFVPAGSEVD